MNWSSFSLWFWNAIKNLKRIYNMWLLVFNKFCFSYPIWWFIVATAIIFTSIDFVWLNMSNLLLPSTLGRKKTNYKDNEPLFQFLSSFFSFLSPSLTLLLSVCVSLAFFSVFICLNALEGYLFQCISFCALFQPPLPWLLSCWSNRYNHNWQRHIIWLNVTGKCVKQAQIYNILLQISMALIKPASNLAFLSSVENWTTTMTLASINPINLSGEIPFKYSDVIRCY